MQQPKLGASLRKGLILNSILSMLTLVFVPMCTGFTPTILMPHLSTLQLPCFQSLRYASGARFSMQQAADGGSSGQNDQRRTVHSNRQYVTPYEKRDLMGVPMQTGVVGTPDVKSLRQKAMIFEKDDGTASWQTLLPTSEEALPEGWVETSTPDGRIYYSNEGTGQVMTKRPQANVPDEQDASGATARSRYDEAFVRDWKDGSFARESDMQHLPNEEPAYFNVWDGAHAETPAPLNSGGIEGTTTLERAFTAIYESDDDDDSHAPILAAFPPQKPADPTPTKESLIRSQLSTGAVVSDSASVPAHLSPGNNKDQLNWAERQLRDAQQKHRPISDLPGFARPVAPPSNAPASAPKDEIIPLWNPLPFIDPKTPRVGIRKDIYAYREEAPREAEQQDKSQEEALGHAGQTQTLGDETISVDLQGVIYDEAPEDAAGYAFAVGETRSAPLVSMCTSTGRAVLRGQAVDTKERAFTFVDEHTCIGCMNCALIARNTFFIEETHGRARVYSQDGDVADVLQEAVDSCPVDCIHPVTFDELKFVEEVRQGDLINAKSRLVSGSYTAEEKGGTPWMQLLAKRVRDGTARGILGF